MIPEEITGDELDPEAREELRTLPKELAKHVARHLVAAGGLVDEDPEAAFRHARTARRLASRVGVVREACGLAAYHAGEWSEALSELRAARRLPGREELYLPILADCERGLGRPERALEIARSKEAGALPREERVELQIVASGARRDLGEFDAAVVALQIPELKDRRLRPWSARLFYAYADALVAADRGAEAKDWFLRAAAADREEETDATERYAELDGLHIIDTGEDAPSDALEAPSTLTPTFQAPPTLLNTEDDEADEEDEDGEDFDTLSFTESDDEDEDDTDEDADELPEAEPADVTFLTESDEDEDDEDDEDDDDAELADEAADTPSLIDDEEAADLPSPAEADADKDDTAPAPSRAESAEDVPPAPAEDPSPRPAE
ncbi:hypothetical protein LO762_31305 [Actinocorallia sp. API 0066]|uniref:hypothetical protein n=1 Tax=Actinocorallia sp. API 0066 TaxID=2896846 RepID=UPI001E52D8FF|nr:hypothetical protein [Actinocorallia sp. API 0066]MCD0453639.1 hypothetical protein [Actinocorallia sp. API 0066]